MEDGALPPPADVTCQTPNSFHTSTNDTRMENADKTYRKTSTDVPILPPYKWLRGRHSPSSQCNSVSRIQVCVQHAENDVQAKLSTAQGTSSGKVNSEGLLFTLVPH